MMALIKQVIKFTKRKMNKSENKEEEKMKIEFEFVSLMDSMEDFLDK